MIHRFDHCVIAVSNVEEVSERYSNALGLAVYPGGKHSGLGTENAIIRFGLDYIELLGIYDEEEVRQAGPRRATLLDYLDKQGGGMAGFCLAANDLNSLAQRFADRGLEAIGPFDMQRKRPDGTTLQWRLLVPDGLSWRKPWPFFIEWAMADKNRLQLEQPGQHRVGQVNVTGVSVAVRDLHAADVLYRDQLGLQLEGRSRDEVFQAQTSTYRVGNESIHIMQPDRTGPLADFLVAEGEGLFECHLAVPDLQALMQMFDVHQVPYVTQAGPSVLVDPSYLWGARLRWLQTT